MGGDTPSKMPLEEGAIECGGLTTFGGTLERATEFGDFYYAIVQSKTDDDGEEFTDRQHFSLFTMSRRDWFILNLPAPPQGSRLLLMHVTSRKGYEVYDPVPFKVLTKVQEVYKGTLKFQISQQEGELDRAVDTVGPYDQEPVGALLNDIVERPDYRELAFTCTIE